jgi:MFS family permease
MAFYYPFEVIFQCLSSFASGIIEKKIGLHFTNLLGFSILGVGYFIMYLSENFFIDILSMIVCGIGTGIIYYPSTKNACLWFMDHTGLVIGIIETVISLGSFLFSTVGEYIINNEEVQSGDNDLYDLEVAKNMKTYLIVQIISVFGVLLLSFLFMFTKKEEGESSIKENMEKMKPIEMRAETPETPETESEGNMEAGLINKDYSSTTSIPKEQLYKRKLKVALKSKRLILYAVISILIAQGPAMMFSLYRGIGEYKKIDTRILQLSGSLGFIFECLSGVITGVLCDYVNLKILF